MMDERFNIFSTYFTVSQITGVTEVAYSLNLNDLYITRNWPQDLHVEIYSILSRINDYPEITAVDFGGDYHASADFDAEQKNYLDRLFANLMPLIEKSRYVTKFECEFPIPNELIISLLEKKQNLSSLAIFVSNNHERESGLLPVADAINNANLKNLKLCLENKHFAFVLQILRKNTSLNELNLVNISITNFYQANEIAVAIKQNAIVKKFSISFDNEDIFSEDLENDLKRTIASGIALNKCIEEVDMYFSSLHYLNLVLQFNQTLKKIANTNCNFIENISTVDLQGFINILYANRAIKTIDLCMNDLRDEQFALLNNTLLILRDFINISLLDKSCSSYKTDVKSVASVPDKFINLYSAQDIWQRFFDFVQDQCEPTPNKKPKLGL